jgi:carbon storage regulator
MLVLSRKVGEKIQISDDITVVVNRIAGNRVTLGIAAPKGMRIVRSELKRLLDNVIDPEQAPKSVQTVSQPVTIITAPLAPMMLMGDPRRPR